MNFPDGIFTVVVTPYDEDGAIDHEVLGRHVDWLIGQGVHAMMPGGTTGEYYAQTTSERLAVLETVAQAVAGRVPMYSGTNSVRPAETIELSHAAKSLGYEALMLAAPYYSLPTESELVEHFRRIGGEVGLPIMLYNFPDRTGVDMGPSFLEHAVEIEQIVAMKESSGSIGRLHELLFNFGDRIQTICGADDQAFEYFAWGVRSWVAGASNFMPAEHVDLFESCVLNQDLVAGREKMAALMPMFELLEQGGKYIQYCKHGATLRGFDSGTVRPPIAGLDDAQRREFEPLLAAIDAAADAAARP